MRVSKFEIIGMVLSVAVMAGALYAGQLRDASFRMQPETEAQTAQVVDATADNRAAARADALVAASPAGHMRDLVIDDILVGSGPTAAAGDRVTVHYIGTLQNGEQFANTYQAGEPFQFTLEQSQMIEGFTRGVEGMQVGGQRIVVVPPALGYGQEGEGVIPGGATLVFAIELLEIE